MRGLLLFGDTQRSAALRHEIPIAIIDPLLYAEVDARHYVLTSHLERARVKLALPDAEVLDYFAFGYKELVERGLSFADAGREAEARAVRQIRIAEAIVPGDFPLALGDRLRKDGVVLTVDDAAVELRRRAKAPVELDGIRAAQRAAEAGMTAACELLARALPAADGHLQLDGKPLLASDVRTTLRAACAEHGAPCPPDVIVASAWQGAGHEPGTGPLPAGLPIQIDIWPRHEASACWADMARTFMVGDPAPEHADLIAEQARLVRSVLTRRKQPSAQASPDASYSTPRANRSSQPAIPHSEPRMGTRTSMASSTHSDTGLASRCTKLRHSVSRGTIRWLSATYSQSSQASGTVGSAE